MNEELNIAALCTCNRMDFQEGIEDLQKIIASQNRIIDCQFQVLKAFSDLYLELTSKTAERQFIEKSILKAEREVARLRLPLWFWRPETENPFDSQLLKRARYLLQNDYCLDDTWDLLREYALDWAHHEISDTKLKKCIANAKENPDACAA